jgi:hypothetical protein
MLIIAVRAVSSPNRLPLGEFPIPMIFSPGLDRGLLRNVRYM